MDHTVNDNIKTNKDQRNDAIENYPKFDNRFNLSNRTKYPPPVVTVIIPGGKKQIEMTVASLTCLWDSIDTKSTTKRRHTKYYECKMRSNKV